MECKSDRESKAGVHLCVCLSVVCVCVSVCVCVCVCVCLCLHPSLCNSPVLPRFLFCFSDSPHHLSPPRGPLTCGVVCLVFPWAEGCRSHSSYSLGPLCLTLALHLQVCVCSLSHVCVCVCVGLPMGRRLQTLITFQLLIRPAVFDFSPPTPGVCVCLSLSRAFVCVCVWSPHGQKAAEYLPATYSSVCV